MSVVKSVLQRLSKEKQSVLPDSVLSSTAEKSMFINKLAYTLVMVYLHS